jgi:hypothetical protein
MSTANGYFEAYVNSRAYRPSAEDAALIAAATTLARQVVAGSQLHWAGSQRKGTAVVGSDLDLCLASNTPVTEAQRRALREGLQRGLGRDAVVLSHAVRLPAQDGRPKVDIAFANAAFGSRPLPDVAAFHDRRARQATARALKLWTRGGSLPHLAGWTIEAMVLHLDPQGNERVPLELFRKVVGWLLVSASPSVVEGVLRPAAHPRWNPAWSNKLPGQIEAVKNHARALGRRAPQPESWRSADDVGAWLGQ